MRLKHIKDADKIIMSSPYLVKNPCEYKGKWNKFFGNDNKIEIEVGTGKGKFIISKALENPNTNYIGIEKYDSPLVSAVKKLETLHINNLKLICFDAFNINDVFDHEDVLQETMIVRVKKTPIAPESVTITSTHGNHDFHDIHFYQAPYRAVVTGKDDYVLILSNDTDKETVAQLSHFNYTLPDIGLKMRTGLTVDFRCRELLSDNKTDDTVPLFYSQHIKNGKVVFPVSKQGEYIKTTQNSLLQKNTNLLFVKRFTSKEEHRRLQPAVYLSSEFKEYSKISTQNKINFICGEKDLSTEQVFGLYVLFNSTLYDNYYRILNGSTQVNSTEINRIPIPELSIIEQMGKDLLAMHNMTETACNHVMEKYL